MEVRSSYIPTERQAQAHRAPHRYKMYGGAMGGGKTVWLCAEVIELMMEFPGNRAIMCRYTLKDFKDTTLVTLMKLLNPALLVGDSFEEGHNKTDREFRFKNGSIIKYTGLNEEDGVKTLKSFECGVFAFDEASEISYENFQIATTRLRWTLTDGSHPRFHGLLASNPEDCWLKDIFVMGKGGSDYLFVQALPKDNPHNPDGYVQQMVKDMGGNEDFIRRYIEGSWDDIATGNPVIPKNMIDQAVEAELPTVYKPVMGVDVAREGKDETVIYYGMNYSVKDWEVFSRQTTDYTVMKVLEMSKRHLTPVLVGVDDIGVGGGVVDFLKKYGSRVKGFTAGRRSEDNRFFNLKAEMWWNARQLFTDHKVSIPRDEKLIRQLGAVQYRYRGAKIIVEPKQDTSIRLGSSPDRADALILMLWAARNIGTPSRDFDRVADIKNTTCDAYGWANYYDKGSNQSYEYNY